jgi:hypothetical protein
MTAVGAPTVPAVRTENGARLVLKCDDLPRQASYSQENLREWKKRLRVCCIFRTVDFERQDVRRDGHRCHQRIRKARVDRAIHPVLRQGVDSQPLCLAVTECTRLQ